MAVTQYWTLQQPCSGQDTFIEQRSGLDQVGGVKALAEPVSTDRQGFFPRTDEVLGLQQNIAHILLRDHNARTLDSRYAFCFVSYSSEIVFSFGSMIQCIRRC